MSIFSPTICPLEDPLWLVGWSLMTRVPCPRPSVRHVPPSVRTRQCPPCPLPSPRRPRPCLRWRVPPPRLHQKDGSGCGFLAGGSEVLQAKRQNLTQKKSASFFWMLMNCKKRWPIRLSLVNPVGVWHSLGSNFEWISLRRGMMPRRSFYIRRPMGPVGGLPTMAEAAPETVTWPSFQKPWKVWRHQKAPKFCN